MTPTRRSSYVPELDGVRGLAIAGVMALHFVGSIATNGLVERTVSKVAGYGVWGVDLFFVLSGFLITGILSDSKGSPRYLRDFYMRRALRIFPLYYGVLFVLFILVPRGVLVAVDPQLGEARDLQKWVWLYLTNFYLGSDHSWSIPYISHFWSLAIEEHFYLFWPFVILLLSRERAMRACILLTVTALASRTFFLVARPDLLLWQTLTPCRLDALSIGAWFALAARGSIPFERTRAVKGLAASGATIVALALINAAAGRPLALAVSTKTTALAAFFGFFIYLTSRDTGFDIVRTVLRAPWLRTLGKYSYGLYVYHGLVAYAMHRYPPEWLYQLGLPHMVAAMLQVALGAGISLGVSVASYELYESRFLALKKWFDYSAIPSKPIVSSGSVMAEPNARQTVGVQ